MRRPCLWVWLGLALLAFSWPGAQVSAEVGPTETECRPHIEKAINNLKAVDADSDSSKEEGLVNSIENEGQVDTEDDNANSAEANSAEDQTNDEQNAEDGDNSQENEEEAGSNEENTEGDQGVEEEEASEEVVSRSKRSLEETANDSEEAVDHKDTDGDGVPGDDDNDGIPDHEDDDVDNNGELSEEEKKKDSDGDGIPDYLDDDDDNDGIPDNLDDDDDNDGVPDSQDEDHENFNQNDDDSSEGGNHSGEAENQSGEVEAQSGEVVNESGEDLERDTDGDGIPDHLDDDDDNDGIPDELDDDDDNDGIPDYLDEDHKDFGKSKEEISGEVENKSGEVVNESGEDLERDTDGDGIPDHLDDDDDNDGIPDELDDDDDNDGIPDHLDEDHPDFGKSKEETSAEVENTSGEDLERDTDGDGIPDYLDDDDDNDGIPDELDDDDDNDGVPDHLDEDHKDFGKSKEEVSGEVQNESGEVENQSGEVEAQSGEVVNESGEDLERDTDGDGIPDHLDDDDDNDGIPDELDDDDDNDGIPDYLDEDHKDFGKSKEEVSGEVVNQSAEVEEESAEAETQSAEAETQSAEAETQSAEAENQSGEDEIDSDGDGIPDSLDDDDDNDGIPDHLDEDHPDYVKSTEDEEEKSAEVENQSEEAEEKDAEKSEEEPEAEAKSEEKSEDNVEAEESAEEVKEESEEKTEEIASVESANTDSEHPEEDLLIEYVVPKNLRNRDHITELLHLDDLSEIKEQVIAKNADVILKDLKRIYENSIKPLETLYKYRDLSNRHFGDPEIFSKPLILFMGPWSGGKSTLINYLTGNEYTENSLRTGAEPSPAYFNILMHGDKPEVLDGTQLAADWTFSGLQKFGQGLEDRLRGLKLPNKLLEKVNIVEIPGILEVRKQVSRLFPFNDACQWFIDRADIIFLVYDPSKLDVGPETEAILDQLKGREYQTRMLLNKADQVKPEELLRVQSALIWNISPLMSSAQPPIMYTTSLWSHPFQEWAPARLLIAQERAMLRDLRSAIDKRIENKIASARRFAVRVRNHAKMVDCYLTTYYNHKTLFGNKKMMADQIIDNPQNYHIYEGLSTLTNISRYDLPDPDVYRSFFRLNPLYEFKKLSETCTYFRGCPINKLDISIAYDLPELAGKYKKLVDQGLDELEKEENNKSSESAPPGKR